MIYVLMKAYVLLSNLCVGGSPPATRRWRLSIPPLDAYSARRWLASQASKGVTQRSASG